MNEINDSWPRCLLLVQALEVGCVKQTGKEFAAWAAFLFPHAALATIFCFFVVASEIGAHHKTHCFLNLAVRYNFSRRASLPDRRWKDGDRYYARLLLCMTYPPWFLAKFWKWLIFSCDPTLLIHWTLRLKTTSALSWISPCLNPGWNYFGKDICSSCLPFELVLWYCSCTCVRCVTHATQGFGTLTVDSWRPSASKSCVFRPLSTVQLGRLFSEAFWEFSFIFGNLPKKYINLPEACAQYTYLTWSSIWPPVAKF